MKDDTMNSMSNVRGRGPPEEALRVLEGGRRYKP